MADRANHMDRDDDAVRAPMETDAGSDDAEDELRYDAERRDDIHLLRNSFGVACMLAVFLLFVVVIEPSLGPALCAVL